MNQPGSGDQGSSSGGQHRTNRSRSILINTVSSYGRDLVDAATLIVLTPFLIQTLGQESFGLWSLLWTFINLFALLDMGFGTSVVKYIADARGRADTARQTRTVATLFWIYTTLGVLVLAGVGVSSLYFSEWLNIPEQHRETTRLILIFLGLRSAICMPLGMFRGVLIGHQKMSVANGYKIAAALLYFVAVWFTLAVWPDIRVLAVLNLAAGVLPMLFMVAHAKLTLKGISIHPRHFDLGLVKELSSFSVFFLIIQLSSLIYTKVDSILIGAFLPLEAVALYAIAMRLAEKGQQFCSHLPKALTPIVAELHGAGENKDLQRAWLFGAKLTTAFAAPLLLGLAVLAEYMVVTWTGPDFALAGPALRLLAIAAFVHILHSNSSNVLSMVGKQKYLAFSMLGGQVLNLGLSLFLIQSFGITGVAAATLFAAIPLHVGLIQTCACRERGSSLSSFYGTVALPCVGPLIVMIASLLAWCEYRPPTSMIEVALLEGAACLVFGFTYWLAGFERSERKYLTEKLLRLKSRRKRKRSAVT